MRIISNLGNLTGEKLSTQNTAKQIEIAFSHDLDVLLSISKKNDGFLLGGKHKVSIDWLRKNADYLWLQCLDIYTLNYFNNVDEADFNCFWLNSDYALSSHQFIITSNSQPLPELYGVAYLPETDEKWKINDGWGLITNFPLKYKKDAILKMKRRKK